MQRPKGPRLYLEKRQGREATWIIRDGAERRRTGLPPERDEDAKRELARYIAETYGPEPYKAQAGQISIPEVLAYYAHQLVKNLSRKNTPAVRRGTATRQIHIDNLLTFWADRTLADVRTSVCEAYEAHRKAMPPRRGMRKGATSVSSATIRQELKTLGRAIKAWHGESPLPAMPVVWKPDAAKGRERYLERKEVADLLRAARRLGFPYLARYILVGAYTGTRDDAMRRLRWVKASHDGWIDTDRGILYRAGFAEEQTSKRRPPMILPDRMLGHLRRWRRADGGLSHVISRNGQPLGDIHKSWASTVKAAGLGREVTPHTLKHTAITWMLWDGKSIWDVSEDTGTSAKTIEEVYGHHRTVESRLERRRQAAANLPQGQRKGG